MTQVRMMIGMADVRIAKPGERSGGNEMGRQRSIARFWSHVIKAGPDDCWLWTGCTDQGGYGRWHSPYWPGTSIAHRIAYRMELGSIAKGLEIDHRCHSEGLSPCLGGKRCHHRRCVNPAHLRAITVAENRAMRRTAERSHCPAGHPFDAVNTYVNPRRLSRHCRECMRIANRASHRKYSEARNADRNERRQVRG